MNEMTAKWFEQYMHHVAANVVDRSGEVRFTYKQLKQALDAVEHDEEDRVPQPVLKLFSDIIGVLPPLNMNDRTEVVLFLALLNCHMAYLLASGYLLNKDESIKDM